MISQPDHFHKTPFNATQRQTTINSITVQRQKQNSVGFLGQNGLSGLSRGRVSLARRKRPVKRSNPQGVFFTEGEIIRMKISLQIEDLIQGVIINWYTLLCRSSSLSWVYRKDPIEAAEQKYFFFNFSDCVLGNAIHF